VQKGTLQTSNRVAYPCNGAVQAVQLYNVYLVKIGINPLLHDLFYNLSSK